jgi:hypothetical protein
MGPVSQPGRLLVVAMLVVGGSGAPGRAAAQAPDPPPPPPPSHEGSESAAELGAPAPPPGYGYASPPTYAPPTYGPPRAPRRIHRVAYEEGMPIPPGAKVMERRRQGLWIAGLAAFGGAYALTALTALEIGEYADPDARAAARLLYVPVLGPLLYLPQVGGRVEKALLVMLTLAQGGGLAMFIAGLLAKKKYLVYYAHGPRGRAVAMSPILSPGLVGGTIGF